MIHADKRPIDERDPRDPRVAHLDKPEPTPEALADVSVPQTDDELNDALEDSFPASDPINFAGSAAGAPTGRETPALPDPVDEEQDPDTRKHEDRRRSSETVD